MQFTSLDIACSPHLWLISSPLPPQAARATEPPVSTATPASSRLMRQPGETGMPSPASAQSMPPPPPPKRARLPRAASQPSESDAAPLLPPGVRRVEPSTDSVLTTESMDTDGGGGGNSQLKRIQKKIREIGVLQRQAESRTLSAEEVAKVGQLHEYEAQRALLLQPLPPTPAATAPALEHLARSTVPIQPAAASAAVACIDAVVALEALPSVPPTRVGTRANALAVERQMRQERVELERTRRERAKQAAAAEATLWALLKAPLDSWDDNALWQLAMCEFALLQGNDGSSSKQLQLRFREECDAARHPGEVPRLRGSMQIEALHEALTNSELLKLELLYQLARYKRFYTSIFSGFGRFRKLIVLPGETLLSLMKRTHLEALRWRPPGRAPAEKLALVSKEKGCYTVEWREASYLTRHFDAGVTLSLRGTSGVTKGGLRRLTSLPESERPKVEHFTTLRLHDQQVHLVYRSKALANSFSRNRCNLQSDEVTLNHLSWSVIVLNSPRGDELVQKEREVIECAKLKPDANGRSKTGAIVGGVSCAGAVRDIGVPAANLDYYTTDTTAYASSLHLPKAMGGSGGEGGAYAHLWHALRKQGNVLFFMIWCLSHISGNEVGAVMKLPGAPRRKQLLRKKGRLDGQKADRHAPPPAHHPPATTNHPHPTFCLLVWSAGEATHQQVGLLL